MSDDQNDSRKTIVNMLDFAARRASERDSRTQPDAVVEAFTNVLGNPTSTTQNDDGTYTHTWLNPNTDPDSCYGFVVWNDDAQLQKEEDVSTNAIGVTLRDRVDAIDIDSDSNPFDHPRYVYELYGPDDVCAEGYYEITSRIHADRRYCRRDRIKVDTPIEALARTSLGIVATLGRISRAFWRERVKG